MKTNALLTAGLCVLALAVTACGEGGAGSGPKVTLSDEEAVQLGNGLSAKIAQNVYMSREMVVQAVYAASLQGGKDEVVKTGTLSQTMFGGFKDDPSPADKLVLKLKDATHEFVVKEANGNTQAQSAAAWLGSDHKLHYTHRLEGTGEVEIKAIALGMGWAAELTGWYKEGDQRYELALKVEGGSYFEQGGRSGQESKTDYKVKGTVSAPGLKLTVDERHFFHLVSLRDAVTHSIDENRNTLKVGKTTYNWVDTSVTKVFRTAGGRMMPVFDAASKWKASGKILKNKKEFGVYKLGVGAKSVGPNRKYHGNLEIVIKTKNGEIVLQSWRGS